VDLRWLELLVLFGVLPVAFAIVVRRFEIHGQVAPALWVLALVAAVVLGRDPSFERELLWRVPWDRTWLQAASLRFAGLSVLLFALGRLMNPSGFLWLPRKRPRFWLLFALVYPVLSVAPQSLWWRVFFAQRYAALLGDRDALVLVGAAAFGLGHLAFWNVPALAMSTLGGAMFFATYLDTQSCVLSIVEHSAYGFVVLTAGLGKFLYRAPPARL